MEELEKRLSQEPSMIEIENKIKYYESKLEDSKKRATEPMGKKVIISIAIIIVIISSLMYFSKNAGVFILLYPLLGMSIVLLIAELLITLANYLKNVPHGTIGE